MKVFDFNIHPNFLEDEPFDALSLESKADATALSSFILEERQVSQLEGINLMVFNQDFFLQEATIIRSFLTTLDQTYSNWTITSLADFTSENWRERIDVLVKYDVQFIKFHCYFQCISTNHYQSVLDLCKYAEEKGIAIIICTSFGTSKMYTYDSMRLACQIADAISKVPIILLHSGGARVIDAMLLGLEKPNVFLETSYSLPFYMGSSIETDLAYAYKKLDGRIVYATDFPYIPLQESLDKHLEFFKSHNFSEREIEDIMYGNAIRLISDL